MGEMVKHTNSPTLPGMGGEGGKDRKVTKKPYAT